MGTSTIVVVGIVVLGLGVIAYMVVKANTQSSIFSSLAGLAGDF